MNLGAEVQLEAVDGLEIRKAVMSIAALLERWRLAGRHELVNGCGVVVVMVVRMVMVVVCGPRGAGEAEAQLVVLLREGRGVEGVLRRGVGVVRGLRLHCGQEAGVAEVGALLSVVPGTTRALQIYKTNAISLLTIKELKNKCTISTVDFVKTFMCILNDNLLETIFK